MGQDRNGRNPAPPCGRNKPMFSAHREAAKEQKNERPDIEIPSVPGKRKLQFKMTNG